MKKQFDWDICKSQRSPETYNFLKSNFNKAVSEDQFVEEMSKLPRNKLHASGTRSPSALRTNYKRLKEQFGFFK